MTEVKLYYANWCGHCTRFKPEWEAIKTKLQEHGIKHSEYEHGKDAEEVERANVKGFPTIRIAMNGNPEEDYTGERTADAILSAVGLLPQTGGSDEDPYKAKYLKYKEKYLALKRELMQ